jgi:hypothetical protein
MNKNITLTMSKKHLEYIIHTMAVALDTDCKRMNQMSEKKFMKIETLHEVLVEMYNQSK